MVALLAVAVVVIAIVGVLAWTDHKDRLRRRGQRKRAVGADADAAREARSDARAYDAMPFMGPQNFRRRP